MDTAGRLVCDYPYRQEDPDVAAVNGGWIVAWIDFRTDTTGDVYAQKLDASGNLLWNATGVVVDSFLAPEFCAVNEVTVRVVHDGQGGRDYRVGRYAQPRYRRYFRAEN